MLPSSESRLFFVGGFFQGRARFALCPSIASFPTAPVFPAGPCGSEKARQTGSATADQKICSFGERAEVARQEGVRSAKTQLNLPTNSAEDPKLLGDSESVGERTTCSG
jgi:hypothetical protein